jgi:hypothetical protein
MKEWQIHSAANIAVVWLLAFTCLAKGEVLVSGTTRYCVDGVVYHPDADVYLFDRRKALIIEQLLKRLEDLDKSLGDETTRSQQQQSVKRFDSAYNTLRDKVKSLKQLGQAKVMKDGTFQARIPSASQSVIVLGFQNVEPYLYAVNRFVNKGQETVRVDLDFGDSCRTLR